MSQAIKWCALESCPSVMNKFLDNLGVPNEWRISDIPSFDDELLCLVPSPVLAVLLLFPFSEGDNEYCKAQQDHAKTNQGTEPDLYFMRQSISNGCGTVALIHAIANNFKELSKSMVSDAVVRKFFDATKHLSPAEKAKMLENSKEIATALQDSLEKELGEKCDYHFVTIVRVNNTLYELDGRKLAPVFHGYTSEASFLSDSARVCLEYMARDPNNLNFTALALGAT